jgi:hypothetical protein
MKKHHKKEIDNPFALAWSMKNKGEKPHYKDDPEGTKSKKEPVKKDKYKDEDKPTKFKEWLELREKREHKKKGKLKFVLDIGGETTEI